MHTIKPRDSTPSRNNTRPRCRAICATMALTATLFSHAAEAPLVLEARIPLGEIAGRIDHLALDPQRGRLYVAELGNNSIGIVDLKARSVIRTVPGFDEPQGVGYEPATDSVYVANGGDGSVRVFAGADFAPLGKISLGGDADNVRIDPTTHRVYVGYGNGALAVIDPSTRSRSGDIALTGHPESFQLEPAGQRIFVNVPDAGEIAVVSRETHSQIATWRTTPLRSNYALAVEAARNRVLSVFRSPARLQAYDGRTGKASVGSSVCGDSDDVFIDSKRERVYVICGEGYVDVFDTSRDGLSPLGRVETSRGSRTGLFVPDSDRLLVAIRATGAQPAAVWVFRASGTSTPSGRAFLPSAQP